MLGLIHDDTNRAALPLYLSSACHAACCRLMQLPSHSSWRQPSSRCSSCRHSYETRRREVLG